MRRCALPFVKTILALLFLAVAAQANVVRLAPEVTYYGPGSKTYTLRNLRGQPVVIVVADSVKTKNLRKQMSYLREIYQDFASRKTVFIAAIKDGSGPIPSNVPFALATNPGAVAAAYGVTSDFSLIIIGKDGNVDYQTPLPRTAQRIRDVIGNSFEVQEASRRLPKGSIPTE